MTKRILTLLLVLSAPACSQEKGMIALGGVAGGPATYHQMDETYRRDLFICEGAYNKDCRLAEGANLDDVVQYFYRQKERDDKNLARLYLEYDKLSKEHRRVLKEQIDFLEGIKRILNRPAPSPAQQKGQEEP